MPNTFGTASSQFPLISPHMARQHRQRFRREMIPQLDRANSLYVPSGLQPARGWILLDRNSYDLLADSFYSTDLELEIDDFSTGGKLRFKNLAIVQGRCVSTGVADDPNAVYLIELTDKRGVLWNQWFRFPANVYYNVLSPAYPANYYSASMNGGSAWTWTTMIQDLWEDMPLLSTYPGLPITPTSSPMNWNLPGVSAWEALNRMLWHIGCSVAVDLRSATPYTIVNNGAADAVFSALQTASVLRLEDDMEWIDTGSGRVPGTVKVLFHRANQYYGTEETIRRDSLQWQTASTYTVSVAAPATFTGAEGTHCLWDDFVVRYDVDGSPLGADVTTAATIAAERVDQYFDNIYSGTNGFMWQQYAGCIPFTTGSLVDMVCWKETMLQRRGWQTEIARGRNLLEGMQ